MRHSTHQTTSSRAALACATVVEVHYFARMINYLSKAEPDDIQSIDGGKNKKIQSLINNAFEILLNCDPVRLFRVQCKAIV